MSGQLSLIRVSHSSLDRRWWGIALVRRLGRRERDTGKWSERRLGMCDSVEAWSCRNCRMGKDALIQKRSMHDMDC
eukprot:12371200-Prorocentrum_lima.AAC.1